MVFSVSPSVTIREVDLTTAIPAITTPPAAIAGVFRWGPTNERILVSSELELVNIFGKPTDFNAETFFTAADFLSYSNALYVTRVASTANTAVLVDDSNNTVFSAKYPGSIANGVEISYVITSDNGDTSSFENDIFSIGTTLNIGFRDSTLEVVTEDELADIDVKVGDVIRINTSTGFQDMKVSSIQTTDVSPISNTEIEYTYSFEFKERYTLADAPTSVTRRWAYSGSVSGAPEAGNMHIVVIDRLGEISGTPNQILERFENLSVRSDARTPDGTNIYYETFLQERSAFIKAGPDSIGDPNSGTVAVTRQYLTLAGGSDGASESTITLGAIAQGYDLYKEANDVDISFILQGRAVGGANLANYLVSNIAESRRDCIVFVSPESTDVVNVITEQDKLNNVLEYRSNLQSSSYWFMDSGYKYRYDKYNDKYRWVPLNGDIAGISSLIEPWESPAGFRKGRIRNVVKLAFNPNKTQRDQLYGKDVNPVITQVGQGTILFGDKTGLGTSTGSAFTRLNVRRLFIAIEKTIATIAAQFLFEFNDEFTQNQFRQIVDPFLRDIQGRRGIIDFRVISDATVNTPDVIDRNTFRANLFIKPARSINFVELTFVATRTGIEFDEIIGQQF
jgi:regulator of extracellular matrix RemA (YlzA/DUF370 family)